MFIDLHSENPNSQTIYTPKRLMQPISSILIQCFQIDISKENNEIIVITYFIKVVLDVGMYTNIFSIPRVTNTQESKIIN